MNLAPTSNAISERGFVVELGTGGLSGAAGGSLALGWGSDRVEGGLALDFQYSSLTGPSYSDTPELTERAIALGPWLRFTLVRGWDRRVDLFGALDLEYSRQSITTKVDASFTPTGASADGVIFRAGPGIRFWAAPWLAVGYTTQVWLSSMSGPLLAFTQSTTLAPSTEEFDDLSFSLVGRFTVLTIF